MHPFDSHARESSTPPTSTAPYSRRTWRKAREQSARIVVAVIAALATACSLLAVAAAPADAADPAGWSLSWADEFNAPAAGVDRTKWTPVVGGGGYGNNELEYYTDSTNSAVNDASGNLVITARKETLPNTSCWYGTCQYTSARLTSINTFTQAYGRFETRMKLPAGQGVWPAFWMQGDNSGPSGTDWPGRGEIDVMENIGREPATVHGTIHGPGYSGCCGIGAAYSLPAGQKFADGFHTFAIEWAPNSIKWFVDGNLYQTRTPADIPAGTTWVFNHPFYILLNFAVGGGWPGNPDASTTFPQQLLVDYVRVYTPTSGSTTTTTAPATTTTTTTTRPATTTTTAPPTTAAPTTTLPSGTTRSAYNRIEAESYDTGNGVSTQTTTDTGGGQNLTNLANGDYACYRNVAFGTGSPTTATMRAASGAGGGISGLVEYHLDAPTGTKVGDFAIANTGGWQNWTNVNANITGATGTHDVCVVFKSGQPADYVNVNFFSFGPAPAGTTTTTAPATTTTTAPATTTTTAPATTTTTAPATTTTTAPATTTTTAPPTTTPAGSVNPYARIEAESYATMQGVGTETTADTGGGLDVAWIANGDWVAYRNVNFGTTSPTIVSARVASGAASGISGLVEYHLDSPTGPKLGDFAIANTGGWQTWTTVPANVSGATGTHDLYVVFKSGQPADYVNLNWLVFGPAPAGTPTTTAPATTTTTPPATTTTTAPATTTTTAPATTTTTAPTTTAPPATGGRFPVTFQNSTRGVWADSQVYVTVLGQATPGRWSYLKADGTATPISHLDATAPNHLTKGGVNYPNMSFSLAQAKTVNFPPRLEGGRIYLSVGQPLYIPVSPDDSGWGGPNVNNPSDPNADVYFDWYEFTFNNGVVPFGGNTTQVDQFGLPMTARLQQDAIGYDQTVGISQTRDQVYAAYKAYAGSAFQTLASQYRIIAPRTSPTFHGTGAQANYLQSAIDSAWNLYTTTPFVLTRGGHTFRGQVVGTQLRFSKDGAGAYVLNKPTTADVMECSGTLASAGMSVVELELGAEMCAALNRGVATDTSKWYTPSAYYPAATPHNDFAGFWHSIGIANRAYGFAYDDVNDQSSVKILPNANPPSRLTLSIGW